MNSTDCLLLLHENNIMRKQGVFNNNCTIIPDNNILDHEISVPKESNGGLIQDKKGGENL